MLVPDYTPELATHLEATGWQYEQDVVYVREIAQRYLAYPDPAGFRGYVAVAHITDEDQAMLSKIVEGWRAKRGLSA